MMNHNQFFNGTFDVGPYETTMDSSFYPKAHLNGASNKYLGKMYNDNTLGDEDSFLSPQLSGANMGYNPSLNTKFKRRIFNKPLQLDHRRASRLKQLHMSANRNDSSAGDYKIPNIHRNLKNMNYLKESKNGRMSKDSIKGGSTSRNIPVNSSFNGPLRLKDKFLAGNVNPNFLNNSSELSELGGLTKTIDLNGSNTSRNMFFTPRKESTENMFQLQRKVNELKEMLSDKDAQWEFLKRTLKFTEINELKQENEILYAECKRLRKFISILTNKTPDGENETEREILAELEEDFTNPGLKEKFKNKKTKIEALLEENDKVAKELQNIRKENQELKDQIKSGDSKKKSGVGKCNSQQLTKFSIPTFTTKDYNLNLTTFRFPILVK